MLKWQFYFIGVQGELINHQDLLHCLGAKWMTNHFNMKLAAHSVSSDKERFNKCYWSGANGTFAVYPWLSIPPMKKIPIWGFCYQNVINNIFRVLKKYLVICLIKFLNDMTTVYCKLSITIFSLLASVISRRQIDKVTSYSFSS